MSATLPGSILPTFTITESTLPTPVASFAWSNFPSTVDTCTSPTLNWDYSGPQETLQFLLISNVSPHTPGAISRKRAASATTLAINVDAAAASWTWSKVNFTAGQYTVEAYGTDVAAVSSPFMIANGVDTSCLATVANIRSSAANLPDSVETSTTVVIVSPSVAPVQPSGDPKAGGPNDKTIASRTIGAAAGVVVLILLAVAAYQVRALRRRRGQPLPSSHRSTESTHPDLPTLYISSETQEPPLIQRGVGRTEPPAARNLAAHSPLAPNRRPPSSLLSEPNTALPAYTSRPQTREWAVGSIMEVRTIGSRFSATPSEATSTAGLMGTFSSCPPSYYITSPSPPPSYATNTHGGTMTSRSARLSYASSP